MSASILSAQHVADYLLSQSNENGEEGITNLKLQKLLYYAQGFHLAMHSCSPLFGEPSEAWYHGPVVPAVYRSFEQFGSNPIEVSCPRESRDYTPEVRELLDCVYRVYGGFTASRLRNMTHNESPWNKTSRDHEISHQLLHEYFSGLVEAGRSGKAGANGLIWPTNSFRYQRRTEIMRSAPRRDRARTQAIVDRIPSPDPWADDTLD
jgi:uncharacterized phage-associated protein